MTRNLIALFYRWLRQVPTERELERLTVDFYTEGSIKPRLADGKVALVLAVLAGATAAASVPYLITVDPERFDTTRVSLQFLWIAQGLQSTLFGALLAFIGLRLGHGAQLGAPLLQHWLNNRPLTAWKRTWPLDCAVIGALVAFTTSLMSALTSYFVAGSAQAQFAGANDIAVSDVLASSLHDSLGEIQLRLFAVTVLVWLLDKSRRTPSLHSSYVAAIAITAIAAALANAFSIDSGTSSDAWIIVNTLFVSTISGVVLGWIYWKRGLEMAMLAHFSGECVTRLIVPLLLTFTVRV